MVPPPACVSQPVALLMHAIAWTCAINSASYERERKSDSRTEQGWERGEMHGRGSRKVAETVAIGWTATAIICWLIDVLPGQAWLWACVVAYGLWRSHGLFW